jgi:tetratricopeptide (TPR) repeat protein
MSKPNRAKTDVGVHASACPDGGAASESTLKRELQRREADPKVGSRDGSGRRKTTRVNVRFVLVLVLSFLALAAVTYALHNVQVKRNSASLRDLADEAERGGDLLNAISYLQQYLQFQPADYDAKVKLADLLEAYSRDVRSRLRVATILEDVLRNDPERAGVDKLRRRLIDLSIEIRRYRQALDHLATLQKEKPADHELVELEGTCYRGLGDYQKANYRFLYAIQLSKQTIGHYVQLAATLSFRPNSLPRYEDFNDSPDGKLITERLRAWFPKLKPKGKKGKAEAGKRKAEGGQRKAETARTEVDVAIATVYENLVKNGRPKHLALLADASHLLAERKFIEADARIKQAEALKKDDPDVLFARSTFAIASAREKSLGDTPREDLQTLLDAAARAAQTGARLPRPKNLRFLLQLADVEQQRAAVLADAPRQRIEHLSKAGEYLTRCETELEAFRNSDDGKQADNANLIRRSESGLLSQQIELLFRSSDAARRPFDDKERERLVELTGRLQRLGASPVQLELIATKDLLSKRQWRQALRKLTRVRDASGQATLLRRQIDLAILTCLRQLQDPVRQRQVLQQSLAGDFHWTEGRIMLAGLLESRGFADEAIEQYRLARRGLAALAIRLRQIAPLPAAERANSLAPIRRSLDQPGLNVVAAALLRAQVIAIDPAKTKTRFDEMARVLDDAMRRNPKDVVLCAARARLETQRGGDVKTKRPDAALQLLDQYDKQFPGSRELLVTRARLLLLYPKDAAKQKLGELEKRVAAIPDALSPAAKGNGASLTADDRVAVLETIAGCYAALGFLPESRDAWRAIAALVPDNLRVRLAVADLDLRLREWKGFDRQLKQIERIDDAAAGGGAWADYVRARRLVVQADDAVRTAQGDPKKPVTLSPDTQAALRKSRDKLLNDAKDLLAHAVKLQPLWPQLHRELGRIERMQGNREAAFLHYDRAFELGDYTASTALYVVHYLRFDKKDASAASARLERAHQRAPRLFRRDDVDASDNIASLMEYWIDRSVRRKDFKGALRLFPEQAGGYRSKVVYSEILFREYLSLPEEKKSSEGKDILREAHAKLREAMRDKKDAPEPWFALVVQLAALDRIPDAMKAVQEALRVLPENVRYDTAARCYLVLGKTKEAEEQFLKAVAADPKNVRLRLMLAGFYFSQKNHAKALPHLKLVLDPRSTATKSQREAARGAEIAAIAASGKYEDYQRALGMLQPVDKATLADLATRVRLYQSSPFRRDRLALIATLEEVDRRFKTLGDAGRFQLARLYERVGRWKDARKFVEDLIDRNPKEPRYLGWYAVELLKHEPKSPRLLRDVRLRVRQLNALQPGSLATASVQAELALKEGKLRDAAIAMLAAIQKIGTPGKKPRTSELTQLLLAARFCETKQLAETAEAAFRRYVQISGAPAARLTLAAFLGRQGRPSEALRIVREAQQACKPVEVAVAAANVVSIGKPSPENLKEAEAIVAAAAKAEPKSLPIEWQQAALQTAAGRFDEAKATYSDLLKKSPGNIAILNNLAWLLAMRNEELPQARAYIEQVILERGPIGEFLDTRGLVLLKMQQAGKALADFQQAVQETDDAEKYLHLALAHLALRDQAAAADAMRKANARGLRYGRLHVLEQPGCRAAAEATGVAIDD